MSKGYSGSANFQFEIERYLDKDSKETLFLSDLPESSGDDFEFEFKIIELQVTGHASFYPGKYSGPPEDCYPDESESEIESVVGPDGKDWYHLLTDSEREAILNLIEDQVVNSSYEDYSEREYEDYDSYDNYYDPSWDNYDPSRGF